MLKAYILRLPDTVLNCQNTWPFSLGTANSSYLLYQLHSFLNYSYSDEVQHLLLSASTRWIS